MRIMKGRLGRPLPNTVGGPTDLSSSETANRVRPPHLRRIALATGAGGALAVIALIGLAGGGGPDDPVSVAAATGERGSAPRSIPAPGADADASFEPRPADALTDDGGADKLAKLTAADHLPSTAGADKDGGLTVEEEQAWSALVRRIHEMMDAHPDVFTGTYMDGETIIVVAHDQVADLAPWQEELARRAGDQARLVTCPRTRAELEDVFTEVQEWVRSWWSTHRAGIGVGIDARTCSVRITSLDLSSADLADLDQRFGDAVTVEVAGVGQTYPRSP